MFWYRRWDSNPHEILPRRILNPLRLPIPPLRHIDYASVVLCGPTESTMGANASKVYD